MPFVLLAIGAIIVLAAIRNTHGDLGNALATDIPGFFKWALAIVAIGALGWIPGMQKISRMLLALVLVVLLLVNYRRLFAGFAQLASNPPAGGQASIDPGQAALANQNAPAITPQQIAGVAPATTGVDPTTLLAAATTSPFDPAALLAAFAHGFGVA